MFSYLITRATSLLKMKVERSLNWIPFSHKPGMLTMLWQNHQFIHLSEKAYKIAGIFGHVLKFRKSDIDTIFCARRKVNCLLQRT